MMGLFSSRKKTLVIAAPKGAVKRSTATLMDQRGWTALRDRAGWAGPYATPQGTWPGTIEKVGGTDLRVFIKNPPETLRRHHKWACFHQHGSDGWYTVHLATNPIDGDPNAVIHYLEALIVAAHKL